MKSKAATRAALGAAVAVTWAAAAVAGAADTWTNTSGNGLWTSGANWQDGSAPQWPDVVTFPMLVPGSPVLTLPGAPTAANAAATSLYFYGSYTLNGGTLEMPGAPITVGPAALTTINSKISSTTGLAKDGNGTLVLGGDNSNTLQGDVHINDGALRYSSDANLGQTWTRLFIHDTLEIDSTFTSMKRMEPANGTIRVTAGNTFTLAANDQFGFTQGDALYLDGPGTIVRTGHTSRFGTTYIIGGTTKLQNGDFGYGPLVVGDATLEFGPSPFTSPSFLSNATTLGANSVLRAVGAAQAQNVSGQAAVAMNATIAAATAGATFEINLKDNPGSAASVFHLAGPGTIKLMDLGLQYAGGWTIEGATLRLASPTSLGSGTSPIPVSGGGGVLLASTSFGRALDLADGSTLRATGTSSSSARLQLAPGANVTIGTLAFGDHLQIVGSTSKINGTGATATAPSSSVTVDGAGKVTLGTTNDFNGQWWLNSGTLRVDHQGALGGNGPSNVVTINAAALQIGGPFTVSQRLYLRDGASVRAYNGNAALNGIVHVAANATVTLGTLFTNESLTVGDVTSGGATGDSTINIGPSSGPVILTHPNDVTAKWVIKFGASLHVSDDAQLGPVSGARPVTLDGAGAELRTLAPVTTTRNIAITAGGGAFHSNGFDSSYGSVAGAGPFAKSGAGTLAVNHVLAATLAVDAGTLKIKPSSAAAGVSTVNSVSIASVAQLDLTNNALIVKNMPLGTFNGTAYDGVTALLAAGYDFGMWDGPGGMITSEADALAGLTGLAVVPAEQTNFAGGTLRGTSVAASDVIVMYTYAGDVNLDGLVDAADYGIIDNYYQFAGTSGYANGDFNFDGIIDAGDYGLIDNAFQLQGAPIATASVPASMGVTMVPEPGSVAIMLLGAAAAFTHHRRRRRGVANI